jgi:hypothetical protein
VCDLELSKTVLMGPSWAVAPLTKKTRTKNWMNVGMRLKNLITVQLSPTSGHFVPRKVGLLLSIELSGSPNIPK